MYIKKETKSLMLRVLILSLALTFLYLPIMTLVVYSFNESKMVTVWTNFSLSGIKHCLTTLLSSLQLVFL